MYVLGVVGSPRKGGNTDLLVEEVLRGAVERGARVEKVYLDDLNIAPCRACRTCREKGACRQQDDMHMLYERILAADGITIGTPVYWWGPSAQTKLFFDRWFALVPRRAELRGKKAVVVAPFEAEKEDTARHVFGMFSDSFDYLGMTLAGTLGVTAGKRGEVMENPEALGRARALGHLLSG